MIVLMVVVVMMVVVMNVSYPSFSSPALFCIHCDVAKKKIKHILIFI